MCIFPQQLTTKMTLQRQLIISNYRSFSCCLFVPSSLFVVTRGSYHPSYFYAYYNINSHLTFDTLWWRWYWLFAKPSVTCHHQYHQSKEELTWWLVFDDKNYLLFDKLRFWDLVIDSTPPLSEHATFVFYAII